MPIHEKSLIREENIRTRDDLVIDGVDVSGHWSTFIESRVVTDYNEDLEEQISNLPGGENIHRCWQCGSCTNSCTVNGLNADFNPRYWIYLIRMGMESELLRDKDIIWQCVSCNKCTYVCPREVAPEGVMKATAHWLELMGHTPKSPSTLFDEVFSEQVIKRGKIEESGIIRGFFKKTGQPLMQNWLTTMAFRLFKKLPFAMMFHMAKSTIFRPKTRGWRKSQLAIEDYIMEQDTKHRKMLGLDTPKTTAPNATQASNDNTAPTRVDAAE